MAQLLLCMLVLATGTVSYAALSDYTEDFSSTAGTNGWTVVFGSPTINHNTWVNDFDDGDLTQSLPYVEGMTLTGDGVLGDGAMRLNTVDATQANEAIGYTLSGTIDSGETVTFSGSLFTGTGSYTATYLQIWDVTDNELLVQSDSVLVAGNTATNYLPLDFSVEYTASVADAGHTIQIRLLENCNKNYRDPIVDNVSAISVVHTGLVDYAEDFSSTAGTNRWAVVLGSPTINYNTWANDFDDGDPAQSLVYAEGMTLTGDGVLGDGAMRLNTADATSANEAIGYTLSGTLVEGERITFSGSLFTGTGSYTATYLQIWDVTDNELLAQSDSILVRGNSAVNYVPLDFSVEYTAVAADAGHTIQIRLLENCNKDYRDPIVDNVSVVSVIPAGGYIGWAENWGVDIGASTNDYDSDGLSNLYEYGLGGDPTNALDQGTSPEFGIVNVGGTNWFGYVHPQRAAYPNSDLSYFLELNMDLIFGTWSNAGYTVAGTNVTGGELDFVTNLMDTVAGGKFIRLIIE